MRMLDPRSGQSVKELQLYLSTREAKELMHELGRLVSDPERLEHFHIHADDGSRQISVSILTERKLADSGRYTPLERQVFDEA